MKLIEALQIGNRARAGENPQYRCFLGCGFTPLHLGTYLQAYLTLALEDRRVQILTGTYGDLIGSLEKVDANGLHGAAIAAEWTDLDPRLGWRHLGGWRSSVLADILDTAETASARLVAALERVEATVPLALSLPSLPLPPSAHTPQIQQSSWEQGLDDLSKRLADWAVLQPGVRLVNAATLAEASPWGTRFDLKSELTTGFPYHLAHADTVGRTLAHLLVPPPPKKGLIVDLDETLWAGILGEVGSQGVHWDLEHNGVIHGVFQQALDALAERGVLVGIASKNDAPLVEEALGRGDLLLRRSELFPVIANWGPKSDSIKRILKAWNIAEESVVFVDDSPLELAEVRAAHPRMDCLLFPKDDPAAVVTLLNDLRQRFGKARILEEDHLRASSLSRAEDFRMEAASSSGASQDALLQSIEAVVTFTLDQNAQDARSFELINKTNQFSLNGRRLSQGEWKESLGQPGTFLLTVSYRDKFGPLGKIAAMIGRLEGSQLTVSHWVMSCRAFSRRIEHQTLRHLFEQCATPRIRFDFLATPRNTALQECFSELRIEGPGWTLDRARFDERCPALFHQVEGQTS